MCCRAAPCPAVGCCAPHTVRCRCAALMLGAGRHLEQMVHLFGDLHVQARVAVRKHDLRHALAQRPRVLALLPPHLPRRPALPPSALARLNGATCHTCGHVARARFRREPSTTRVLSMSIVSRATGHHFVSARRDSPTRSPQRGPSRHRPSLWTHLWAVAASHQRSCRHSSDWANPGLHMTGGWERAHAPILRCCGDIHSKR
jgi:hypothetical protein